MESNFQTRIEPCSIYPGLPCNLKNVSEVFTSMHNYPLLFHNRVTPYEVAIWHEDISLRELPVIMSTIIITMSKWS